MIKVTIHLSFAKFLHNKIAFRKQSKSLWSIVTTATIFNITHRESWWRMNGDYETRIFFFRQWEREREREISRSLFSTFTLHYHISCYKISVMCLSIRPLLFSTKQYGSAYSQRSILHFCWYIYFKGLVNILLRIVGLRKLLKRFLFLLTLMASQFGCERIELRI